MVEYQLYLKGRDGHFIKREDIEASDDAAAIEQVGELRGRTAAELWAGSRLITAF